MTLDEAKRSAKEGIVSAMNGYIDEVLPSSMLLHALTWRVNALIDGLAPTTGAEALMDAIFNFVAAMQTAAQPFFPQIDAATTVEEAWAVVAAFDPQAVPPPSFSTQAFYSTRLETIPE